MLSLFFLSEETLISHSSFGVVKHEIDNEVDIVYNLGHQMQEKGAEWRVDSLMDRWGNGDECKKKMWISR